MADYARTLAAVDEVLATDGLRRFLSRADQLSEDSLSADPFVERLRLHICDPVVGMSGGDLLALITPTLDGRRPSLASIRGSTPLGCLGTDFCRAVVVGSL